MSRGEPLPILSEVGAALADEGLGRESLWGMGGGNEAGSEGRRESEGGQAAMPLVRTINGSHREALAILCDGIGYTESVEIERRGARGAQGTGRERERGGGTTPCPWGEGRGGGKMGQGMPRVVKVKGRKGNPPPHLSPTQLSPLSLFLSAGVM